MKFDRKRFNAAKWQPRTEAVPVPDLSAFFELAEGESPVWTVRGLTGKELGTINEAAARGNDLAAVVDALAGGTSKEKAKEVARMLGIGGNIPADVVRRAHQLVAGSVEPTIDLDTAWTLCKAFPVEFFALSNKIVALTGQGHIPGKAQPSGKEEK